MPIQTSWYDDDHRVVLQKFSGNWTWAELSQALKAMQELPDAAEGDLIVMNDMSNTSILPQGNVLMQGKAIFKQSPPNISLIVFVLDSRLIKSFVGLVFEMMPSWRNRLQFAKTLQDAHNLVEDAAAKYRIRA